MMKSIDRMAIFLVMSILLGIPYVGFAQGKASVQMKEVETQGTNLLIHYDLSMVNILWCDVDVYLSCDGGKTFASEPLKAVSGDVGRQTTPGAKLVKWKARDEASALTGEDLVFMVKIAKSKSIVEGRFLVAASLGLNTSKPLQELDYGAMLGWCKRAGFYVKFKSNFNDTPTSLDCTENGNSGAGYIWTTGETKVSKMECTAGLMVYAAKWLYFYVGGGYGNRTVAWETADGRWAKVSDYSYTGAAADAGAILRFGMFSISVGATSYNFKYFEPELGIGIMF